MNRVLHPIMNKICRHNMEVVIIETQIILQNMKKLIRDTKN